VAQIDVLDLPAVVQTGDERLEVREAPFDLGLLGHGILLDPERQAPTRYRLAIATRLRALRATATQDTAAIRRSSSTAATAADSSSDRPVTIAVTPSAIVSAARSSVGEVLGLPPCGEDGKAVGGLAEFARGALVHPHAEGAPVELRDSD